MNIEAIILFSGCAITFVNAYLAWRKQDVPGRLAFVLMNIASSIWSFCDGMENLTYGMDARVTWSRFSYLGIAALPLLWMIFSLQYTQQDRWLKKVFWRRIR